MSTLLLPSEDILLGFNKGLEVAELPNPSVLGLVVSLSIVTYQVFMSIAKRKEEKIYVSLWYVIAALIWTDLNFIYGNFIVPSIMPGISNAEDRGRRADRDRDAHA